MTAVVAWGDERLQADAVVVTHDMICFFVRETWMHGSSRASLDLTL